MVEKVKVTGVPETMIQTLYARAKETGKKDAKITWGVKNGKELQKLVTAFSWKRDVSLVEGMKVLMPVYHVIGRIPIARNISNKIVVMEK